MYKDSCVQFVQERYQSSIFRIQSSREQMAATKDYPALLVLGAEIRSVCLHRVRLDCLLSPVYCIEHCATNFSSDAGSFH